MTNQIRIHVGCGSNVLDGYTNIDLFPSGVPDVQQSDLFALALTDDSVDEILAEHVVEHMSFKEEEAFFFEAFRVLKPGGLLEIEVPDMEWLCERFLSGTEGFPSFYRIGVDGHYFGNGSSASSRWGIITTHFFGNQNGEGQFHKTGFSRDKVEAISEILGFDSVETKEMFNKGAQCLRSVFRK